MTAVSANDNAQEIHQGIHQGILNKTRAVPLAPDKGRTPLSTTINTPADSGANRAEQCLQGLGGEGKHGNIIGNAGRKGEMEGQGGEESGGGTIGLGVGFLAMVSGREG